MEFHFCTIRTGDEDDDTFYPVLGSEPNTLQFDDLDGSRVTTFDVEGIEVSRIVGEKQRAIRCCVWPHQGSWLSCDARIAFRLQRNMKRGAVARQDSVAA